MNELIPLHHQTINNEPVETVNARELHSFLEVQTRFNDWIATRISEYDFVENQDYVRFTENPVKPQGGRPSMGYFITLRMAKELSMVERNDKGKQARKYFIECEERLKASQQTVSTDESKMRALAFVISQTSLSDIAKETLLVTTAETALGFPINYRPCLERKTYTATQIGEQLGVSANKVGKLANAHNLKTDEYGVYVLDKSAHSVKQVSSFRYYDNVIPILKAILANS